MLKRFLTVVCVLTTVSWMLQAEDKKEAKFDPAKLVGDWKITEGHKMGEKSEAKAIEGKITFDKEKITIKSDFGTFVMSYKVDEKASPATIDMVMTDGPVKDAKALGIIGFDGDTLKLCYTQMDEKRPTEFSSKKDSKNMYFLLKKDK